MIGTLIFGASTTVAAAAAGVSYAALAPKCQWFGHVLSRGPVTGPRQIALTFDDGPTPGSTERILECLDQYDVPASFFCIGRNVRNAPELLHAIDNAGHLIANHSYDHARDGAFHGRRYWINQLEQTNAVIHDVIGRTPKLFRPPMGIKTPRVLYAPNQLGMHTVTWTHRGFDTRSSSPPVIVRRLTRRLSPGSLLMLHDGAEPGRQRDVSATCAALPMVIEAARQSGFVFARLDEVLGVEGYAEMA